MKISKEGPTGLILSTAGRLDYDLSTRMISVSIDDSPEITGEILRVEALAAAGLTEEPDLSRFHAYDRLIGLDRPGVIVPYSLELAVATLRNRRVPPVVQNVQSVPVGSNPHEFAPSPGTERSDFHRTPHSCFLP